MNIIEKLEQLQRYEQGRHGEMQKAETYHSAKYISDHDLRAIIEEYKNAQEPVAWHQVPDSNPYKRLTDEKTSHIIQRDGMQVCGYVLQKSEGMAIVYNSAVRWLHNSELFNFVHCGNSQLSDETVKDAERYRWLRQQNELLQNDAFVVLDRDVECEHCESTWVGADLDLVIDEAMKAKS